MSLVLDLLLLFLLRNLQGQDTIVHLSVDVVLGELITNIEAAAHAAGVMLAADVLTFLVLLIVVNFLLSGNGHVAIIQLDGSLAR